MVAARRAGSQVASRLKALTRRSQPAQADVDTTKGRGARNPRRPIVDSTNAVSGNVSTSASSALVTAVSKPSARISRSTHGVSANQLAGELQKLATALVEAAV